MNKFHGYKNYSVVCLSAWTSFRLQVYELEAGRNEIEDLKNP